LLGACEDGNGGQWGVVLAWRDAANHRHTWIVPRELLHGEAHVIAGRLEAQGLRCSIFTQDTLLRFLALVRPERRLTAVEKSGWHGDSYVLPSGEIYGNKNVMLRPELVKSDQSCAIAGTLADWQDDVARYAVGNSRLAFYLSAAFAGSLLEICTEPSGGFHLHGPSRDRKTTCALCATSVLGKGGRGGNLVQWRATANGLEAIVAMASDGFLVLDEISQTDSREASNIVYMISNETGKLRMTKYIGARPVASWCVVILSTGEVTMAQKMAEAGKRTLTGAENRLVNISSDAGAGMGVFEELHGFTEPALLADHLRHAAATTYGTAGRAFLARLVAERAKDGDGLERDVRQLREHFITDNVPAGADGQVRSVAGRFGMVAAAGELAAAWEILPWKTGEASDAAAKCFKAWLGARGGIGAGEEQIAIRQVRAFFEQNGVSRFDEKRQYTTTINGKALDEPREEIYDARAALLRCGWREMQDDGTWQWLVLPEAWRTTICQGIDADLAAKALDDKGWLERVAGRDLTCKRTIPGHGRLRVYVINAGILEGDAE
jgi:uncharacterized protein (DUF927 family)